MGPPEGFYSLGEINNITGCVGRERERERERDRERERERERESRAREREVNKDR